MTLQSAFIAALAIALASSTSSGQGWNDARTRALVERATERRAMQLADTALVDYQAKAHGYLTFLAQFGEGFTEPPKIVKADELGLEIYWRSPDLSKQRIVGRRDTLLLPTDINYHRDHLGIVQNNFRSIIRLGDGDEVQDVPHPLSATGLQEYDYAIRDSLQIRLGPRSLNVYEVRVRPRNDRLPRAVGAVYIDRESGEVVRMAFSFTRAALRDKELEDVSVVLENALIDGRFWLPRRQEIEIRRSGSWLDYPARGIIRGRWEICCYEVNRGIPASYFVGPEIVQSPPSEPRQVFPGSILDSLPSDVRAVTDEDVKKVQEEARALVRSQSLARSRTLALSARRVSDFVRYNRVEGLAVGSGVVQRLGGGLALAGSARYGFSDEELKGRAAIEYRTGAGAGLTLSASRSYRDLSEEPERSLLVNSIAAQEFGSDHTDPLDVRELSLAGSVPGRVWRLNVEAAVARHAPLEVNARPASGAFEATVPALGLDERRFSVGIERPTSLTYGGFELSGRLIASGIRYTPRSDSAHGNLSRFSLGAAVERPLGRRRLVLRTIAGVAVGPRIPVQHHVFLGGATSAPGYEFHEFVGKAGLSQRIELQSPVPFPSFSLGRYGRSPASITLAPFATFVWNNRPPGFAPARQGLYSSLGVGALTLFDVLRFDVARGLRGGRWTFSLDVNRAFWRVL